MDTLNLTSEVDRLVRLVDSQNPFDMPFSEVLPRQLAAVNERFKDRIGKIKLLQNRAQAGGIGEIGRMADIVPLLFAHTAYKSYPEAWLVEKKWDRLGRWLDTVSTDRVQPMDVEGIDGLDDWLQRLETQGHFVNCSSGTTGKCAMMNASAADLHMAGHSLIQGHAWATGIAPRRDRRLISLATVAATPRNLASRSIMRQAYNAPDVEPFAPPGPPVTVGSITEMVVLRRKIADGTAKPAEIACYEQKALERERAMEKSLELVAEALIESRARKLYVSGLFGPMYKVAERVRARGYCGADFSPENTGWIGGGLKRERLPSNYREYVFETLNLSPERMGHGYGMQELNTNAMRCKAGRYHMAPWVVLLLLDESGEHLIEPASGAHPASGEHEGRAAFFDLSLEGRWGGLISGDKIRATWETCACGHRSPSIHENILRYADTAG
ncbi:MAG TPA: hypothetical protein VME42_08435, partial [Steroidobacteraceae bacterium]|nr:hypothetical protein [Steroidobacteraceae bacterium]